MCCLVAGLLIIGYYVRREYADFMLCCDIVEMKAAEKKTISEQINGVNGDE